MGGIVSAVWWILSILLVLIIWALEFILSYPLWLAILLSAIVVTVTIAIAVYKLIRAGMSARALENAIAQQAAQQVASARPERRAEIQELQKQITGGISALKTSKLGGKKGGASALYRLPWYMIIGPPGAGKTTALKHSGLVFPTQAAGGGGVRGVGGTRNCDWWFTNESILLDTAGRYTTESDDRDEWIAFLNMLKKYRSRQPINGVLVAISITDLVDANEQQIEATGKKLRARIDEVMTQLQMVIPVYVLFTKCDLIAGFVEFFGDMRKTERQQAWGTTLKLDMPKNEPGKIFDTEFDLLVSQIHGKSLKRLATERNREAREKIYQFPLEFAGIKRNLADLIAATFAVNSFQGTPIFRGFYFTSGTQEGKPLERVLGRMGQAMGLRPPETTAQQVAESKSYFLYDVFMKVVFPDATVAARSAAEIRRQWLMRIAISGSAAALGVILMIPGIVSFANNRTLLADTETRAKSASTIQWNDNRPPGDKLDTLKPLLDRLVELDEYEEKGVPFSHNFPWFMYQGDVIRKVSVNLYVSVLGAGFVIPMKNDLEARLKKVKGDHYLKERNLLRTYLMMSDIEHLDVELETGMLTNLWAEKLRATSNIAEVDLKKKITPHVRYYLTLLKNKRVPPVPPNEALINATRKTLQAVPVQKRYYDFFVNSLIDEKYDEGGEDVRANRKYPPVTLGDMFSDRPDVLKFVQSALHQKEKRYKEVEGPYTENGHYRVLKNVAEGTGLLEREQWVVPLTRDEQPDTVPKHLARLADDYDQRYAEQWTDFILDIQIKSPATVKEAIELFQVIAKPDWAYLRILRQLEDHTQWKKDPKALERNEELGKEANRRMNQQLQQRTGFKFNVDIRKIGDRVSTVPGTFKSAVEFAIPSNVGSHTSTQLAEYISKIEAIKGELSRMEDASPNLDPRLVTEKLDNTAKDVMGLLQPFDDKAKSLLTPMLTTPLRIVTTKFGYVRPGKWPPAPPAPPPGKKP